MIDARAQTTVGTAQTLAEVIGDGVVEAAAAASSKAGRDLAYPLLAVLEQSGWAPGAELRALRIQVDGLVEPALVEEIGAELAAVAEVEKAGLWEVGYRSAIWQVEAVDSGLRWDTILGSIRLQRGRLVWRGGGLSASADRPRVVQAAWVEP